MLFFLGIVVAQGSEAIQSIEPIKTVLSGGANPIEITKTIGTFDGINNVLPVMVELKYLGRYTIDIGVIEYVENNKILNCSGYKIINTLNEIYDDANISTHSVDLNPSSIEFNIHNLYPKNRVRFNYSIDISHRNDFQTYTTARFYSEDGYPDSDYSFRMSTSPVFDVTVNIKEIEVPIGKPIELAYNIMYLGPADVDIVNATFDSTDTYELEAPFTKFAVRKGDNLTIPVIVAYPSEGKYRLPRIYINGKNFYFEKTIAVISNYNVFSAYMAVVFSSVVSIMALLPGVIALIPFFKKQRPPIKQRIKKKRKWL